jgi:hypothetical protein
MHMRTSMIALVLLAGLVLIAGGCNSTGNGAMSLGPTTPLTIEAQIQSDDPGFKYPDLCLITSKADLEKLHSQELSNKGIDFDTHTVVLLTLGEKPTGGYWGQILGVEVSGDDVYVQGMVNGPAKDAMATQTVTHVYAAAVCPRFAARNLHKDGIAAVTGLPQPAGTSTYQTKNIPFSASPAVTQPTPTP